MPPTRKGPIALVLATLLCSSAQSDPRLSQPTWTIDEVRQSLEASDSRETLGPMLELARAGEHGRLLEELERIAADRALALPVRERLLFDFAVSLSDLDSRAADPAVLEFLLAYEPRVLLPHEDAPMLGVPLYNVRGATAGSIQEWRRQEAAEAAAEAAPVEPEAWLAAYLASGPAQRQGYVDSLSLLPEPALRQLAERAAGGLPVEPGLTPVVSRSAVLLADSTLLRSLVSTGHGPEVAPALRSVGAELDESERFALMNDALRDAPAANAALAVAEFAPGLLHHPETTSLLFGLLGHPDLGAVAALALSRSRDAGIHERLAERAAEGQGLEARRATLAAELAKEAARRGEPR